MPATRWSSSRCTAARSASSSSSVFSTMISSPAALAASLMLRVLWPKNGLAMSATTTPTVVVVPLRVLRAGRFGR